MRYQTIPIDFVWLRNNTLLLVCFLFPACTLVGDGFGSFPTDETLEKNFQLNRSDFDEIVMMSRADSTLTRITYDFTWVEGSGLSTETGNLGISPDRWNDYIVRFRRIKLKTGIDHGDDGSVWFRAYSEGLGVSGVTKGYFYSDVAKDCKSNTLNSPTVPMDLGLLCKRIDDNWYIFVSK